ncbi:PKD domain containing protein [Methanocaldococcus bathoardescens]|uniref:PKD domain containing protein n=2 Tax=Methanocaldococcus bathoardescens TaxID=1301915 RepID=A0A076LDQ7_9EURY|nr:PKD domain containing protein [Methanocaldococcus bathoardescens]
MNLRVLTPIIVLISLLGILSLSNGYIIKIHDSTMNITNSSGYTNNYNPYIIAYKVNDTLTFEALAPNSVAQDILDSGVVKWDFGDLTETDYGSNKVVTHKYSFPFPYPVAWCGYLNNTGYSKALTYNWLVVGDVANTKYILNGSPLNSKTSWDVLYDSVNNIVIIKYYSENTVNTEFNGLSVDTTTVSINASKNEIVMGDVVKFSYSVNRNIILNVWCFGDGTFSFEKSPEHIYTKPGFYYPRVLVIDDFGRVMVGYLDEGIKVNKPHGGYLYVVYNHLDVENSSGYVNNENPDILAYKVNDTITFTETSGIPVGEIRFDFGDTSFVSTYSDSVTHIYKFPFMFPVVWSGWVNIGGKIYYVLNYNFLIVDDIGNTRYNFLPSSTHDKTTFNIYYDKVNHIVNISYYSDNPNPTYNLKIRDGTHEEIPVHVSNLDPNVGEIVSFSYDYNGTPIFVMWSFGDGSYSFENNPKHAYSKEGYYNAYVFIIDKDGNAIIGVSPIIGVGPSYSGSPGFYVYPTIVGTYEPVSISVEVPDSLKNIYYLKDDIYYYNKFYKKGTWYYYCYRYDINYGDGNFVSKYPTKSFNLIHSYPNEGRYRISLTVYKELRTYDEKIEDDFIAYRSTIITVVDNQNPVAKLYVYPNPASYKDTIFFNPANSYDPDANRNIPDYVYGGYYTIPPDSSMAEIYGFNLTVYNSSGDIVWNYSSNELKIISHKFNVGNYTAILTVWDGFGGKSSTEVKFEVINNPPIAQFTYSPKYPEVNETVTFDALLSYDTEGAIKLYKWDFGDGYKINTTTPTISHEYNRSGTYLVKLTVYDELNSSNTISKTITVYYVKADFESPSTAKVNTIINFADKSVSNPGSIVKWFWDFGDGTTSNEKNPSHKYSREGVYTVTLTVWNDVGVSDKISKTILIRGETNYPPIAKFNFTINGLNVTFDASSSYDIDGNIVKYIWDFGDGYKINTTTPTISYKYDKSGTYTVKLTVIDDSGNIDSTVRFVSVGIEEKSIPIPLSIEILILITTLLTINYITRRW